MFINKRSDSGDFDDDSRTLIDDFNNAEAVVNDITSGQFSSAALQGRIKRAICVLENLTKNISLLGLFSDNEQIEDLPTSSLCFLLIPCYLGVAHHNIVVDPTHRAEQLRLAKMYYNDFLRRLECYGFEIGWSLLFSEQEEESCSDEGNLRKKRFTNEELREQKIARYRKEKEYKGLIEQLRSQLHLNRTDESVQRALHVAVMKYWSQKVLEELESIEEEMPLVEMMQERMQASSLQKEPCSVDKEAPNNSSLVRNDVKSPSLKPFIITRSAQQKSVFGLGYPSIPTMTVDEWYNQRFGSASVPSQREQKTCPESNPEDACSSKDEPEEDDDRTRARSMMWDEYKDNHRRGWGNTHNKG